MPRRVGPFRCGRVPTHGIRRTLSAVTALGTSALDETVTTEQLEDLLVACWGEAAAKTFNRRRAAVLSFFASCADRSLTTGNVAAAIQPRKVRRRCEDERRERLIDRDLLAELWAPPGWAAGTGCCGGWRPRLGPAPTSCPA
jgi:hypothetical protein